MPNFVEENEDEENSQVNQSAFFAMDVARAAEYARWLKENPREKQVCICGHTVNSHQFTPGYGYNCKPAAIWCRCENPTPVYLASDSRFFKRSTHGAGMKHALGLGIASLESRGGQGKWMIELRCFVENCRNLDLTIACVNEQSMVQATTSQFSVFLCKSHAWEMGGHLLR